MFTLTDL